jgi:hypothetical protein
VNGDMVCVGSALVLLWLCSGFALALLWLAGVEENG